MGGKDKKTANKPQADQCFQDCSDQQCEGCDFEGGDQVDIQEKIIQKIKELSTLPQKVQAIAINSHLIEKRELDKKMQDQIEAIERKFKETFNPYIDEINAIVTGQHVFNDADFQEIADLLTAEESANRHNYLTNEKIADYWYKAFKNSDILDQQIEERDQPLLKHLQKVQVGKSQDLKKLWVTFYFSENEWFTNTKLHKEFQIDGIEIKKSYGDQINWKQGKNITVKVVKKKNKKKGAQKKTKEVKEKSFFNFFKDIEIDSEDEQDEQHQEDDEDLQLQYQMAQNLYQEVVPKSLQYYLGVIETYDQEELQEIEEQDQEEEQENHAKKGKGKNKKQ